MDPRGRAQRAIDAFRREAAKQAHDVNDERLFAELLSSERTDSQVERRDDARRVRGALLDLPGDQRRVIELAYFGGFTHTEIARMLDLPAGTVKGRMRLGLAKLRVALSAAGFVP
jgi:RNA polymerase sigma-70 factor (ECF subfamily)